MHTVGCRHSKSTLVESLLIAAGMLVFAADAVAQPASGAPQAQQQGAAQPSAAAGQDAAAAQAGAAEADEVFVPDDTPGLAPVASYVTRDEITVRGQRPGEIRQRLWDLDTEIESTINDFYKMLNEIVVDEQFHVICERGNVQLQPGVESRIKQRFCYAGYQLEELRAKRDFERDGGVYEPDQAWLRQKEEEFAEVVFAAMDASPALVVAAEKLALMHDERQSLTGGDPAMSLAQLDRQRARESVTAPFERRELRRQREAEREAERAAEREAERQAQRTGR